MIPVFDGHNDFLQRMIPAGPGRDQLWLQGDGTGALDLPRMRAGGMAGGFFATTGVSWLIKARSAC